MSANPAPRRTFSRPTLVVGVAACALTVIAVLSLRGRPTEEAVAAAAAAKPATEAERMTTEVVQRAAKGLSALRDAKAEPSSAVASECPDGECEPATERVAACGNGYVEPGEQCDVYVSHAAPNDGCNDDCTLTQNPCAECSAAYCTDFNGLGYDAVAGCPADDTDCYAMVECAQRTGCAKDRISHCYCGPELEPDECAERGGEGVCRDEVERAFGTRDPKVIAAQFIDPSVKGGRAGLLLTCHTTWCKGQCLPERT